MCKIHPVRRHPTNEYIPEKQTTISFLIVVPHNRPLPASTRSRLVAPYDGPVSRLTPGAIEPRRPQNLLPLLHLSICYSLTTLDAPACHS